MISLCHTNSKGSHTPYLKAKEYCSRNAECFFEEVAKECQSKTKHLLVMFTLWKSPNDKQSEVFIA